MNTVDPDLNIVGFNDHNENGLPDERERAPFDQFDYKPGDLSTPPCRPSAVAYPRIVSPGEILTVFVRTNCDTESVLVRFEIVGGGAYTAIPASRWSDLFWTLELRVPFDVPQDRLGLRILTRHGELSTAIKLREPPTVSISDEPSGFDYKLSLGPFPDCNDNWYPDWVDIPDSLADDLNHNQIVDDCEPDSVRARIAWDGRWPNAIPSLDKADLATRYFERHRVRIRYAVSPASAPVRVDVVDRITGALIRNVVNKRQRRGVYQLFWHCDDSQHRLLADGRYRVVVNIGGLTRSHIVGWQTPSK